MLPILLEKIEPNFFPISNLECKSKIVKSSQPSFKTINYHLLSDSLVIYPTSKLQNIKVIDWQFQALKQLTKKYNVVVKEIKNTTKYKQTISRSQYATWLKIAVDELFELNAKNNFSLIPASDLATIARLQSEFSSELKALGNRIEQIEVRLDILEQQQTNPRIELTGEAILAVSNNNLDKKSNSLIFSDRVWLNFDVDFNETDSLFIRLEAENTPQFDDISEMSRLGFDGDSDNQFDINQLEFEFSLSKNDRLTLTTDGSDIQRIANSDDDFSRSGRGAISRFGRYSPFYRLDFDALVRLKYEFGDFASISLGLADDDADDEQDPELDLDASIDGTIAQFTLEPTEALELFFAYQQNGNHFGVISQLVVEPKEDWKFGLTYLRFYDNLDTNTGSELANEPFRNESDRIITNSYGLETSIGISSNITLSSWLGFTNAKAMDLSGEPEANIFHYAVTLGIADLGTKDSLGGMVIGQPPRVISNDLGKEDRDRDTALHLEIFYRYQMTDSIAITPGLFVITNPNHDADNNAAYVGSVRTTFAF